MSAISRRKFLARCRTTGCAAAGLTVLGNAASVRGTPAHDRIVMAVVGVRGRGSSLGPAFAARTDCRITYLCDVDSGLFASRAKLIGDAQGGTQPTCVQDFRKALDDKSVDAMVIATPDHWHVPAAIWSCQAGKDVYVEKPLSHNAREGRKLVEIAQNAGASCKSARRTAAPRTTWPPGATFKKASWAASISAASAIRKTGATSAWNPRATPPMG